MNLLQKSKIGDCMRKETKKRVSKTLKFSEITNEKGIYVGGGILNTIKHIPTDLWVELMDDPLLNSESEEEVITDRIQLHLGGTRRGFEELGVFLLALAKFHPPDDNYSLSFDLRNVNNEPAIHLIVHLPVNSESEKKQFSKVHSVAKARISLDGNQVEDTYQYGE